MVPGIIVTAVGDELVIGHPFEHATLETVTTVLGGPALFLAGHLLFKRAVFRIWSVPRLAAIAVLAIIAILGRDWTSLAVSVVVLLLIAAVSSYEIRTVRYAVSRSPTTEH